MEPPVGISSWRFTSSQPTIRRDKIRSAREPAHLALPTLACVERGRLHQEIYAEAKPASGAAGLVGPGSLRERISQGFQIRWLAPDLESVSWRKENSAGGTGVVVKMAFRDPKGRCEDIRRKPMRFGTVPPELLRFGATKTARIAPPEAGSGRRAWFCDGPFRSDVHRHNMRRQLQYEQTLAGQAVAFLLGFGPRFDHYLPQKRGQRGPEMIDLPEKTVG